MTTLVAGGTGKTGRRVAARLKARGVPVRIGSRSAEPPFDWEDRSTWGPALHGASAAYIAYYPDLAVPGSTEAIAELASIALAGGTRRLVLLSGRGEEEARRAERALADSGAEWTVVRCSWFMQNFSEEFLLDQILAGEVALPAGDVPAPFVDAEDIADVAVAALTEDGYAGRVYELTGPSALTHAEAIAEIARATGRDVRYVPISLDAFVAGATADGVPAEVVSLLAYLYEEVLVERNAGVADGVGQALGREPRAFADYARDTAATGVWSARAAA
ncbi:MAG TPA: NAD(P)H-binding protein [Solirubrobacteraceae bacterium]|nr:NAD(P)H-binding protein [Solirubrobacteraceae bacterium]